LSIHPRASSWSSAKADKVAPCQDYFTGINIVFRYPEKALLLHQKLCIQAHIIVQFSAFLSEDILPIDSIHCLLSFKTRMELGSLHFFDNNNAGELRLARNMR